MKRIVFIFLGCLMFVLGLLGVFLPFLPTVPFFLATGFFWLNSSEKLHAYLLKNKYYNKYITEMVVERKMPKAGVFGILVSVFVLLAIPFTLVDNFMMRVCLVIVFIGHAIFLPLHFARRPLNTEGVQHD